MTPIEDESEVGQQMRLSREIIVLDFGDEANSPYDEKEKTMDQKEEESRSRNGEADVVVVAAIVIDVVVVTCPVIVVRTFMFLLLMLFYVGVVDAIVIDVAVAAV